MRRPLCSEKSEQVCLAFEYETYFFELKNASLIWGLFALLTPQECILITAEPYTSIDVSTWNSQVTWERIRHRIHWSQFPLIPVKVGTDK